MFDDTALITHLDEKQALEVEAGCFVELNQNDPTNIDVVGVYKWGEYPESMMRQWTGNPDVYYKHETLTTDMRKSINNDDVVFFGDRPKSEYFNLADCFTEFRPRSGIVKTVQPFKERHVYVDDFKSVRRPRSYICSVEDEFKYWTSWNTDISPNLYIGLSDSTGMIKNAAPFVVYKEPVAANMITVKIQTGIGEAIKTTSGYDPLSDPNMSNLPKRWRIEYLNIHNTWVTAYEFREYDRDLLDPATGVVDLIYKSVNPDPVRFPNYLLKGFYEAVTHLPIIGRYGEAFCIGRNPTNLGKIVIWNGSEWEHADNLELAPDFEYQWELFDYSQNPEEYAVTDFVDPLYFNPASDSDNNYTQFIMVNGLRIVVEQMVAPRRSFDLIELSPRLFGNLSKNILSYTIDKAISEDSILPVGDMSVSHGEIVLSNMDLILNRELEFDHLAHTGSILSQRIRRNTKFILYEIIKSVMDGGLEYDKFIPVKTLYAMEKPTVVSGTDDIAIALRDMTFYFEEHKCPNIVLKECSLSKAVAVICDYIGFSNYVFKMGDVDIDTRYTSPMDTIIPYFFVNETMSAAEALQALAVATQCAIFFNENNNLVVMPREHFGTEPVYTFRGGSERLDERVNIEAIDSIGTQIIADAEIKFIHRDIARERYLTYRQSNANASSTMGEAGNLMGYKVSPLWDASKLETNTLGVGVLRTELTSEPPYYDPSKPSGIANDSFDIGYWTELFPEFRGLVFMNGEVIRYDAKQYSINGQNTWVTSQNHLNELIGQSPFKSMVYPTGLMRIYTEITKDESGHVALVSHGRGMFNTPLTYHPAEPTEWISGTVVTYSDTALDSVFGVAAPSNYAFSKVSVPKTVSTSTVSTNYIYNPLHSRNSPVALNPINISPHDVSLFESDRRIMRSSALTFAGPSEATANQVFLKVKQLPGSGYTMFGTRMGIIGSSGPEPDDDEQSPFGSMVLGEFKLSTDEENSENKTVLGAGGGLAFWTNRLGGSLNNDGYFLEVTALNSSYTVSENPDGAPSVVFANVNFYKINNGTATAPLTGGNVAVKLWSTYMDIRVTTGSQTARDRLMTEYNLVYDLAVEVKESPTTTGLLRTFYVYINDIVVGVVYDHEVGGVGYHPSRYENTEVGVFVRGSSIIQLEHLYAVGTDLFNDTPVTVSNSVIKRPRSFKIYSPSALFATIALTGGPQNSFRYYEEFGSMARECRRIDATFELFPALKSQIAPMPIFDRAYSVTHYTADPYNASMMLWAQSDRTIRLTDDMTLNIYGLTFANNAEQTVKLDDFLTGRSDSASQYVVDNAGLQLRNKLLANRAAGMTDKIVLESPFIQSREYAEKIFKWLMGFIGTEKTKLSLTMFGIPHIQIGDIVTVDYDMPVKIATRANETENVDPTTPEYNVTMIPFEDNGKRFIVRHISIDRNLDGPTYSVDLVEMPESSVWNVGDF